MAQRAWVSMLFHNRKTQLLLVNSLTFGLEVCLAAGITYVPPLLLEVGVEEKFMTMVLGRQVFFSSLRCLFPLRVWRAGANKGMEACLCRVVAGLLLHQEQPCVWRRGL